MKVLLKVPDCLTYEYYADQAGDFMQRCLRPTGKYEKQKLWVQARLLSCKMLQY